MSQLEFHPAADLFPLMAEDSPEFRELVEDIRLHGLRETIDLLDGKILDGRNRYRACLAAGLEPDLSTQSTEHYAHQPAGRDPVAYVLSKNLYRRHLTVEQRAEVLQKLHDSGMSTRQIAEKAGVSQSTVARDVRRGRGQVSQGDSPGGGETGTPTGMRDAPVMPRFRNEPDEAPPKRVTGRDQKSYPAQAGLRTVPVKVRIENTAVLAERTVESALVMLPRVKAELPRIVNPELVSAAKVLGADHISVVKLRQYVAEIVEVCTSVARELDPDTNMSHAAPASTASDGTNPITPLAITTEKRRTRAQVAKAKDQLADLQGLRTEANQSLFDAVAEKLAEVEEAMDQVDDADWEDKAIYREEANFAWNEAEVAAGELANLFDQ